MDLHENIAECVGNTPLLRLTRVIGKTEATIAVKLESLNPGGSIKDRAALSMIREAEQRGLLQSGGTVVEATSGNTGYAVSMLAAARGYQAIIVCTDTVAPEKLAVLRAYGARVIIVPADAVRDAPDHYLNTAHRIASETAGAVFINQSFNPANPEAHYRTTGPEIWEQTDGQITTFVASAGTGGTVNGVGRFLKEKNADIEVVLIDPVGSIYGSYVETGRVDDPVPHLVEAAGQNEPFIPGCFDPRVVDRVISVSDVDSFAMARRLAREEGIFCGISSGMIISGAIEAAREKGAEDLVIAVIADTGDKYLARLYSDDWLREHLPGLIPESQQE